MQIAVDQEKCCSAGTCVMLAPDVFDQRDDDGIVLLLDAKPPAELHAAVREAADLCPAAAIYLTEDT
ncbi:ferredoxin [Pengzhenrongella sp.]|jgi:ferredoxin|uniref:ferredoxin n=1 Tax=Pengzhenrongella sp. TaxID=2888820 RepID=UPI002F9292B6